MTTFLGAASLSWLKTLVLVLVACVADAAIAVSTLQGNPGNYRQLLPTLKPGDTLQLEPGNYDGLPIHGVTGTEREPIVIKGSGEHTTVVANPTRNTLSIRDSAHVVIRDLRLDGHGHPTDGVVCEWQSKPVHNITLENIEIVNFGFDRSTVGIATRCTAWGWIIRGNRIVKPGTGMYLGNSDGTAPFVAGVIDGNEIIEPRGYGIQIKHQIERPRTAGMPEGRSFTVISRNRITKSRAATDPEDARPNLLVGHFPQDGAGADDMYLIHGNVLYDNATDALFQGEGNIALYNNLLVNTRGDAVNIWPHNHRPRTVYVFNNTIVAAGTGISIRGGQAGFRRHVAGNAVFAGRPLQGEIDGPNVAAALQAAAGQLRDPRSPPARLDLSPWSDGLARSARLPSYLQELPEARNDFMGRVRTVPVFGACLPAAGPRPVPCR